MGRVLSIPPQFKEALDALRENGDTIRTILGREPHREGASWAIRKFDVLRDLFDSETKDKEGKEFKKAEKKVRNIINRHVLKHVETEYMIDENNEIVKINHTQQGGDILPLGTDGSTNPDVGSVLPRSNAVAVQQQQHPLPLPLIPNPFRMIPVPVPIIQQTGPVYHHHGDVNNNVTNNITNNITNHGAGEEEIEKINENLDGIREEQKKQSKEIGDLKSSHTDLKSIFHHILTKK